LTQGLLQIPFGLLSDRIGRKVMIVFGLTLFGIGSAVAGLSTTIGGVIVGRAVQGAGAVGSVILALVADLTGEDSRTAAMAMVGITIGASFIVALLAGPVVASFIGVAGIFWLMVPLALVGMAITQFVVPNPPRIRVHRDAEAVPALLGAVLRDRELLRLDLGIFALHAMLTASFLVVPDLLHSTAGVAVHDQWIAYLPVLLVSIAAMVPAIIVAEKYRRMKGVFVSAVLALLTSQIMLFYGAGNVFVLFAALVVFFLAFNVMEASLPSLITKVAPPDVKGTAMGVYSSLQFLGIFVGGIIGGMAHQHGGSAGVFAATTALAAIWLIAAAGMAQPSYLTTRLVPIGENRLSDAAGLKTKLLGIPGVFEAVIIADENLAYLKVDSKSFDAAIAEAVAGGLPPS
jgi:predicted MFS family arabinose efflux permease